MWVEMVADKTELLHSNCAGKMVNTDSSLKRTIYTYLNSYPASVFLSPTSFSAKWQVPSFELSQEIWRSNSLLKPLRTSRIPIEPQAGVQETLP